MAVFRRLILIPIIVCLMTVSGFAFEVPALYGRVNDHANLMTQTQRDNLEGALRALEEKTTVQVAILTVSTLQGKGIKDYSITVARAWKLGQKDKNNGLLLLYSTDGDHYRIEVGYGLEGAIPDITANHILREQLRPHADPKKGLRDFDAAFGAAVQKISEIVYAEYEKDPSGASMRKHESSDTDGVWMIFVVALFIAGVCGAVHEVLGGAVGAAEGAGLAAYLALGGTGFILLIVVGAVFGFAAKYILELALEVGIVGGGSSSGGFSGGGGSFGGGGADD